MLTILSRDWINLDWKLLRSGRDSLIFQKLKWLQPLVVQVGSRHAAGESCEPIILPLSSQLLEIHACILYSVNISSLPQSTKHLWSSLCSGSQRAACWKLPSVCLQTCQYLLSEAPLLPSWSMTALPLLHSVALSCSINIRKWWVTWMAW